MSSEWKTYRIEDIAAEMGDAPFGSNLKNDDYCDSGALVVQGKNIQGRVCDWTDRRYVSFEKYTQLKKNQCFSGDLLFPKVGTIGKVGLLTKALDVEHYVLSTNTMKLRVNEKLASTDFVYYYFLWPRTSALIAPLVLSTPDQIEGALPLVHTPSCVIKVHGDYLDPRIKNTPAELDTYDPKMDALLDQVFDQFGLVTCGWSADWDVALRKAIERAPSRRFTTYWASRGTPSEIATKLIQHRTGQLISITDADSFFRSLQEKVEALERFSEQHPLSVKTAVASTKKYLAEERYRIRLHDLIDEEVTRVIEKLNTSGLLSANADISNAELTARVRKYEAACKTLVAMAAICGQWGDKQSAEIWQRVQQRLYSVIAPGGVIKLLEYQRYPITLITYAGCLGALLSGNFSFISTLVQTKLKKQHTTDKKALEIVPPFLMLQMREWAQILEGMDRRHAPLNDWLHSTLHDYLGEMFTSSDSFTLAFDAVEILLALAFGKNEVVTFTSGWRPPGCYGYRRDNFNLTITDITNSFTALGEESPYVKSGLFGNTTAECLEQINALAEFKGKLRW